MKSNKIIISVYSVVNIGIALSYFFTDFGKVVVQWGALFLLFTSTILLVGIMIDKRGTYEVERVAITVTILIQLIIVLCWLSIAPIHVSFFRLVFHGGVGIFGIFSFLVLQKSRVKSLRDN